MSDEKKQDHITKWLDPQKIKVRATAVLSIQRINDTISLLLEGREPIEIVTYLKDKYGLGRDASYATVGKARREIKKRKLWEVAPLIELHLERYELLYKLLNKHSIVNLALQCLKQKEKLLQFHKNSTYMRVNNEHITQFTNANTVEYKPDKLLTEKQQDRLRILLNRAYKG